MEHSCTGPHVRFGPSHFGQTARSVEGGRCWVVVIVPPTPSPLLPSCTPDDEGTTAQACFLNHLRGSWITRRRYPRATGVGRRKPWNFTLSLVPGCTVLVERVWRGNIPHTVKSRMLPETAPAELSRCIRPVLLRGKQTTVGG